MLMAVFSFQTAFSQANNIPGFVIKNGNDTLFGLVDYRNWEKNPDQIRFKINKEDDPVSLGPLDIVEFSVADEIYVSGIVEVEISPIVTDKLDQNPELSLEVDTTFLQTIIRGEKSLYHNKSADGKSNFYIQQDNGFELLVYKKYLSNLNGTRIINENNKYRNQLVLYFRDCPTLRLKMEGASYNQKSLIKLFQNYYECTPQEMDFQKETDGIKVEIGALGGVSITTLNFLGPTLLYNYQVNTEFKPSLNPTFGMFVDFILPRNQGKWSIYNELQFTTYRFEGKFEDIESEDIQTIITTELSYPYLKLNNLIRFKFPIGSLYIFLNGGMSNGFSLGETNYRKEEIKFYTTQRIVEGEAIQYVREHEQGYVVGMGVKHDKFSLELRYEAGNGMSELQDLASKTRRYYLLFGYKF